MTPPSEPDPEVVQAGSSRWLTRGVASVGAASFFSDSGHELTTSLLPTLLASTLSSGPAALGAVEGFSDALMGVAKLAGGPLSAEPARRARLASGGYLLTGLATAAIGLATSVWQVGLLRAIAWASRGIRSPARDTLLVSLVSPKAYGRASGVERAGDNAGALLGPLLASLLVTVVGVRHAILLSVVPSLFAVASISVAAREARRSLDVGGRRRLSLNLGELRASGLAWTLAPVALFELGNAATTLLILRATTLLRADGRSVTAATSLAILLYAAHNALAAVAAVVGGRMVDSRSARTAFALGGVVYVGAYSVFAVPQHQWPVLLLGFLLAGVGIGLAETAESASVAISLPDRLRGNGYGALGLVQACGDIGATVVAGILWSVTSATVAFAYLALWMAASVAASGLLRRAGFQALPAQSVGQQESEPGDGR